MKIAILGAGALAIGFAKVLEARDFDIVMWTKFEAEKEEILTTRVNSRLFPGIRLADEIKITTDIKDRLVLRLSIGITFHDSFSPSTSINEDDVEVEINPKNYEKFKKLIKQRFLPRLLVHMINNNVEETIQKLIQQCSG